MAWPRPPVVIPKQPKARGTKPQSRSGNQSTSSITSSQSDITAIKNRDSIKNLQSTLPTDISSDKQQAGPGAIDAEGRQTYTYWSAASAKNAYHAPNVLTGPKNNAPRTVRRHFRAAPRKMENTDADLSDVLVAQPAEMTRKYKEARRFGCATPSPNASTADLAVKSAEPENAEVAVAGESDSREEAGEKQKEKDNQSAGGGGCGGVDIGVVGQGIVREKGAAEKEKERGQGQWSKEQAASK